MVEISKLRWLPSKKTHLKSQKNPDKSNSKDEPDSEEIEEPEEPIVNEDTEENYEDNHGIKPSGAAHEEDGSNSDEEELPDDMNLDGDDMKDDFEDKGAADDDINEKSIPEPSKAQSIEDHGQEDSSEEEANACSESDELLQEDEEDKEGEVNNDMPPDESDGIPEESVDDNDNLEDSLEKNVIEPGEDPSTEELPPQADKEDDQKDSVHIEDKNSQQPDKDAYSVQILQKNLSKANLEDEFEKEQGSDENGDIFEAQQESRSNNNNSGPSRPEESGDIDSKMRDKNDDTNRKSFLLLFNKNNLIMQL